MLCTVQFVTVTIISAILYCVVIVQHYYGDNIFVDVL